MKPQIICFGETLWDVLPSGKMPGGAPMNVAIHLTYNNFIPLVISRVGNDDSGHELLDFLRSRKIPDDLIQVGQSQLTGVVNANISDKNEVTYDIVEPVAWDYIRYEETTARLVAASDVFIYGSLAARSQLSRATLLQYLLLANLKVCDVNLRPPHYQPRQTEQLLGFANIAKMNHQELTEIASWYGQDGELQPLMAYIKKRFGLQVLLVTRGENGAAVLTDDVFMEHGGCTVEVEDTIGSGDAFLATFLSNYLQQERLALCLERACLVGAYVATQKGATPVYVPAEVGARLREYSGL